MPSKNILIFAAVLLVTGCDTLSSLDEAVYTMTEGVTETDRIHGRRTLSLADRSEQIKEGDRPALEILEKARSEDWPLNEAVDPVAFARLREVFDRVHAVSHFRDEAWNVVLMPLDAPNAFVTGGTYVFVHQGMLSLADDDELAAVLGHEIGHVAANHGFEQRAQAKVMGVVAGDDLDLKGYTAAFTAVQEREADEIGILYATLAGYDPAAAARLWRKMGSGADNWTDYRDHPGDTERAAAAVQTAQTVARYRLSGQVNPDAATILACNDLFCPEEQAGPAPGQGGGLLSALTVIADTALDHMQAKTERKRQQALIAQQVATQDTMAVSTTTSRTYAIEIFDDARPNWPAMTGTMRFDLDPATGRLTGAYSYGVANNLAVGQVQTVQWLDPHSVLLRWRSGMAGGLMIASFTPDGTIVAGEWYQGEQVERRSGAWRGRMR